MREFLTGALGVALIYPVVWYEMAPIEQKPEAPPAKPVVEVPVQPSASVALREVTQQVMAETLPVAERRLEMPAAEKPAPAPAPAPKVALAPLPEALPKTVQQMSELQRLASDPQRLAERVQALDSNSADLAELKAFAEMFVALPPERVEEGIINARPRPARQTFPSRFDRR